MSTIASIGIAPILFFAVVGGLYVAWYFTRSQSVLAKWALANGYEILHSEHRGLRKGPFLWTGSAKQAVYYVRVRSRDGEERSGWVRCGGFWGGLLGDKTEVKWEDQK